MALNRILIGLEVSFQVLQRLFLIKETSCWSVSEMS